MKVAIVGVSGADVFILSVVNKLPSRSLSITTTSRESMLLLFRPVAVLLSNSQKPLRNMVL